MTARKLTRDAPGSRISCNGAVNRHLYRLFLATVVSLNSQYNGQVSDVRDSRDIEHLAVQVSIAHHANRVIIRSVCDVFFTDMFVM